MGQNQSDVKYVILYGLKGSGKTLFLYNLHAKIKIFDGNKGPEPTEGFNYEEKDANNYTLGIFDISGDPMQYEVLNIIAKSVNISGIIFMVSLDQLDELKQAQELLKLVFSNQYFTKRLSLYIIYNRSAENKEKYEWMSKDLFKTQLNLDSIKEQFRVKFIDSDFLDCSNYDANVREKEKFATKFREFSDSLDDNYKLSP